ncbi:MAG: hypothetical protein A2756_05420 [Candidatus Ryanbacteria bacterium RIFCSPHIGHO2_01_FULL_48_27]|uniref:Uncharacterized protein n=1 Tax=Candidatus Ryanbacteria bacterium RIFCSPHIGHO2_01_FULL_48_27 TaxID=1802115 RepID=A0A1G2G492_9BACT|nr:MAG: hypothetical protein A2756_05420 [Candidatus Ryanbacteria bacterium RIFCSPHIGHO2_01_FULL_48_27]
MWRRPFLAISTTFPAQAIELDSQIEQAINQSLKFLIGNSDFTKKDLLDPPSLFRSEWHVRHIILAFSRELSQSSKRKSQRLKAITRTLQARRIVAAAVPIIAFRCWLSTERIIIFKSDDRIAGIAQLVTF